MLRKKIMLESRTLEREDLRQRTSQKSHSGESLRAAGKSSSDGKPGAAARPPRAPAATEACPWVTPTLLGSGGTRDTGWPAALGLGLGRAPLVYHTGKSKSPAMFSPECGRQGAGPRRVGGSEAWEPVAVAMTPGHPVWGTRG